MSGLILCDDTPRFVRGMDSATLSGVRYQLFLEGSLMTAEEWTGSEYTENVVSRFWIKGEGRIEDREKGADHLFLFTSWSGGETFRECILGMKKSQYGCFAFPQLFDGKESLLIDLVCERTIEECSKFERKIPQIRFFPLKEEELVEKGWIFDQSGQAHLQLVPA